MTDYIVLGPSKVGDTILLLQRYTCGIDIPYCDNRVDKKASDYFDGYIDIKLNNDVSENNSYKRNIEESIRNYLVKTNISRFSIKRNTSIVRSRDVFILCCKEVGFPAQNSGSDSDGISYLDALKIATGKTAPYEARQAYDKKTGDSRSQWLREEVYDAYYGSYECASISYSISGSGDNRDLESNGPMWACDIRPALSFNKLTPVDKSSFTLISK